MNNPESITVDIETARKLREAGWEQSKELCLWYWYENEDAPISGNARLVWKDHIDLTGGNGYSAPTCEEILRELPYKKEIEGRISKLTIEKCSDGLWDVCYMNISGEDFLSKHADTLASASALMWIFLKENNLL